MVTKVSNPLTIVAIFAGLAEAFATYALIHLSPEIQQLFVYFVMAFPTLIVLLFFGILNWNHTVLYAPGDFEDENMYLESIRLKALKSEVIRVFSEPTPDLANLNKQQLETALKNVEKVFENVERSSSSTYILELLNKGPSTANDIAQALKISDGTVRFYLKKLADEGKIQKVGNRNQWSLA